MQKIIIALGRAALTCSLGGCVADDVVHNLFGPQAQFDQFNDRTASSDQEIPWQLMPASAASRAQGEVTYVTDVSGLGRMRGTAPALAQIHEKIVPYTKNGRLVQECRAAMEPQAVAKGAYSVEANAAGPLRVSRGLTHQQVFFRILYRDQPDAGIEIRQASLDCSLDRTGRLTSAKII